MADASRKNSVDINVLYANFTELQNDILGYITVEAKGNKENIESAIKYMEDRGVVVKEVIL